MDDILKRVGSLRGVRREQCWHDIHESVYVDVAAVVERSWGKEKLMLKYTWGHAPPEPALTTVRGVLLSQCNNQRYTTETCRMLYITQEGSDHGLGIGNQLIRCTIQQ